MKFTLNKQGLSCKANTTWCMCHELSDYWMTQLWSFIK